LLCSFYAISFANLKKYKFTYHYTFPALHSDPAWRLPPDTEPEHFGPKENAMLVETVQSWRYKVDSRQHGFFLARRNRIIATTTGEPGSSDAPDRCEDSDDPNPSAQGFNWSVGSIASFKTGFFDGIAKEDRFIAFVDPSTYPTNPGWMLRNYLVLIRQLWGLDDVKILCYRDTHPKRDQANSIILRLQTTPGLSPLTTMPKVTGWERTQQGKITSRIVDLAAYMDPINLADSAVDLNLKLIKWRIAPSIDLDVIKNTSCLLLGAGTLGSYVSRNLMGWGVRKITFIDSGNVSFSNPVRQPLFRFEDCLDGGRLKAVRAAEALKEIYPGVEARGVVMNVPMVGHPTLDERKAKKEFEKLEALIDEHDVLFLLLDSRESRWLPTLMGKAAGKIVLNAALGFESYVVMRQGLKPTDTNDDEVELGCYFCNDVVAPANVSCVCRVYPNATQA
jgi:ubiquitin-like modifier-activating enzyme ATG7